MQCEGGQDGDVQYTPLETVNAAADQVPTGAPNVPPEEWK